MRKSFSLFAIFILGILSLVIPLITLTAFKPLNQQNYTVKQQATGMNETDFINTMFLRSTFFENWSETNYFINPTLKTSKSLTYNDKWYLDFLKDSYSTGISFDKPSDEFMDLYKNWDTYTKQYNIDKFYDVDKKQFLKELTNFSYSFAKYFNTVEVINKLEKGVDNLQLVNLKFQNWKLITKNTIISEIDNKYYFAIKEDRPGNNQWFSYLILNDKVLNLEWINILLKEGIVYIWNLQNEPIKPDIDKNTGKLKWYTEYYQNVRNFLLKYINVSVQENIRVQQGGNPDYDDPNLGSERIIFDFEIVDESLARNSFKSIYRMILTIDERKNIIAGSLELFHNWKYADEPVKNQKDKLGFLFTFMKEKDNIFNFDANTNSYLENGNIKYYEKMKGKIDINKFLKFFLRMRWCLYFKIVVILLKVVILIIYNTIQYCFN